MMFRALTALVAALLLAGCGMPIVSVPGTTSAPITIDPTLDVGALGGLGADIAAHPSVQLARPKAFALTAESSAFLDALARQVEPQRRTLASRLAADTTVTDAVSRWTRMTGQQRLDALKRVADLEGEVMGFQVPPITPSSDNADQQSVQAYFQPANDGLGEIVVFTNALASGNAYRAIATVVHEARHAAQFQLAFSDTSVKDADSQVLGDAYASAWQFTNELGDESKLAYGDYTHLTAEYDAFQTGNEVAAILSGGQLSTVGYGFVDMQYDRNGSPVVDPTSLNPRTTGRDLIAAVNAAEYQFERALGAQVPRQRDRRTRPVVRGR
jgi:hypothetical protein